MNMTSRLSSIRAVPMMLAALCVGLVLQPQEAEAGPIAAGDDLFTSIGSILIPGDNLPTMLDSLGTCAIVRRAAEDNGMIVTELVTLDLFGISQTLGPVHVRAGTGAGVQEGPSPGKISNVVSGPGTGPEAFISGNSFFDVLFELDAVGMTLYNRVVDGIDNDGDGLVDEADETGAAHMSANDDPNPLGGVIKALPPLLTEYSNIFPFAIFKRLGAFNDPGDPMVGIIQARVETHTPQFNCVPEPSSLVLLSFGALSLGGYGWRRRRKETG